MIIAQVIAYNLSGTWSKASRFIQTTSVMTPLKQVTTARFTHKAIIVPKHHNH